MALIIEDGSLVSEAVSYVSVEEVRAYALARASILTQPDNQIEAMLVLASDYLETFRNEYQGSKVNSQSQSLQFPRAGVIVDGYEIPKISIPQILKSAQCQLALESLKGIDLMPTGDGREVIREKVDVLETEYSPGAGGNPQPVLARVKALLYPLLKSSSAFGIRPLRV